MLEVCARLLDTLDLPRDTPPVAFVPEASPHDINHALVKPSVEAAAFAQVVLVAALEPAVRIEIPAELQEEVECEMGARRKHRQSLDVGEEFEHAGGKGRSGEGVVEVVLQAVQVEVYNCDFAVELGVEGCGSRGGVVVA